MSKRLAIIALDAMDFRLASRWAGEGLLPTLARLMKAGSAVPLRTPPAVLEGAIWPTLFSGTLPATHAMYAYLQLKKGSYDLELGLTADRLTDPPFWAYLSDQGKSVALIDVPLTRPLTGLNGIQIVNWGGHDASWSWPRSSWPSELMAQIDAQFGPHPLAVRCDDLTGDPAEYRRLLDCLIAGTDKKTALLCHLWDMKQWDFFFAVYSESHCIGHQAWHFMDSHHPRHAHDAAADLKLSIQRVYRAIDDGVAVLLNRIGDAAEVIVLLTHGMGPYYHGSHLLDAVIHKLGINRCDKNGIVAQMWNGRTIIPASARQFIKKFLPRKPLGELWMAAHRERWSWPEMRAFAIPSSNMTGSLRINLKGREPAGLIEPGAAYEEICGKITEALLALENPASGHKAVRWVKRAAELFRGPRIDELPDLFVEWEHDHPITALTSAQIGTVTGEYETNRTGSHIPGGLLIGLGPSFAPQHLNSEIAVEDLAPTILNFFQVESPSRYEGTTALRRCKV